MTRAKVKERPAAKRRTAAAARAEPGLAGDTGTAAREAIAAPAPAAPSSRDVATVPGQPVQRPGKVFSLADEAYPEGTTKIADDFNDTNPFDENDWRVVLNAWAGFVLRLIIVVSTAFGINQYLVMREESRVQRTLDLVELWERPEYQTAQRALKERLNLLNEQNQAQLGTQPTQFERSLYYEGIGLKAMTAEGGTMSLPQFGEHFDRMVYLLNRVAFCVEEGLCSQRIADAFFRDYAESFWRYFSGYIAAQRKAGSPKLAVEIEQYVLAGQAQSAK